MTISESSDQDLGARLTRLADHLVESVHDQTPDDAIVAFEDRPSDRGSHRWIMTAAAAIVVVGVLGGVFAATRDAGETSRTRTAQEGTAESTPPATREFIQVDGYALVGDTSGRLRGYIEELPPASGYPSVDLGLPERDLRAQEVRSEPGEGELVGYFFETYGFIGVDVASDPVALDRELVAQDAVREELREQYDDFVKDRPGSSPGAQGEAPGE